MGNHLKDHYDSTCPLCRDECFVILNDSQARAEVEQELDPQSWLDQLVGYPPPKRRDDE